LAVDRPSANGLDVYGWLVPRVVLPLYERASGRRPWTEAMRLGELQWRSSEELEALALAKVRRLLKHASRQVPFYRNRLGGAGLEDGDIRALGDLARIPLATRSDLRASFPDGVVAANVSPRRRERMSTGGSSGVPLEFFSDRSARDVWLGTHFFFLGWAGVAFWDARVTITSSSYPLYSATGRGVPERVARGLRRLLLGERSLHLIGIDLSVEQLRARTCQFAGGRGYFIRGYASYLARLAVEILEREVQLAAYPKVVISHAETLTPESAANIERAFRCRVVNQYSTWEVPQIAQSCPDNPDVFHVNSERAVVRLVRADGTEAPPGEQGRVVITDLINYVAPFINYDIGDWALAGPACPCGRGFPTLARIEGKTSEQIRTVAGRVISSSALSHFLLDVFPIQPYVLEFQALQTADAQVVLRVVPSSGFSAELAERLRNELEAYFGPGMGVRVEAVEQIATEPSGKRPLIKSLVRSG